MVTKYQILLILLAPIAVVPSNAASATIIIEPEARPLRELAERLEKEYGWRVTYEEAPLQYMGDLVNIGSRTVQLIARPTGFTGMFEVPKDINSIPDKHRIVSELVRRSAAPPTGNALLDMTVRYAGPQTMVVSNNGDYSHIIPVLVKNRDGQVVAFKPLLSTHVSFEPKQRNLFEAVSLILSQVSGARNVSLGLGTVPTNLFLQRQQLTEANDEEARDVLVRIFEDASGLRKLEGFSDIRLSWELMCDYSMGGCFYNVHFVNWVMALPKARDAAPRPSPATSTPSPANCMNCAPAR